MYTAKRQLLSLLSGPHHLRFLIPPNTAAAKLKLLVKNQVSAGISLLHRQRRERLILPYGTATIAAGRWC